MGSYGSRQREPEEEERYLLKLAFEKNCLLAAQAIAQATFFQLATGAGFSADSGLAVYKDVARIPVYEAKGLDYPTICSPQWLESDPSLFYGFWGACFNDYRKTDPHEGYRLIKNWRDMLFYKNEEFQKRFDERSRSLFVEIREKGLKCEGGWGKTIFHVSDADLPVGPFYIYTSNVCSPLFTERNTETWQCGKPCKRLIWRAPRQDDFRFDIEEMGFCDIQKQTNFQSSSETNTNEKIVLSTDKTDVISTENEVSDDNAVEPLIASACGDGLDERFVRNAASCPFCKQLARPAILMFGDFGFVDDDIPERMSDHWEESVIDCMGSNPEFRLVLFEVGCGNNVTTVRGHTETLLSYCAAKAPGRCTLIRVNPDFPLTDNTELESKGVTVISIMSYGLVAIKKIDDYLSRILSGSMDVEAELRALELANAVKPNNIEEQQLSSEEDGVVESTK